MRNRAVRRAECCIGLAVLAGVSSAAGAQDVRTGLQVSGGVSVESNPYNATDSDGASVALFTDIRPMMQIRDDRTTIDLTGSASFRQFLRQYGLEDNYSVAANINTQVSERVKLRTNGSLGYTKGGYGRFGRFGRPILSPLDPTVPVSEIPIDPTFPDVAVIGQRARFKTLNIGVGTDFQVDDKSNLTIDLTGQAMRTRSPGLFDYNSATVQATYSRRLTETTSVGVIVGASKSNFLDRREGDGRTVWGMLSVDHRLNSQWSLSAAAGVARTKTEQGLGLPTLSFSSLTGNLRLCKQGEFSQFCLGARRSPEPSANGGVRVTDAIDASYSRRLSEYDRISVSGSYARTGRGRGTLFTTPPISFYSLAGSYDRQINERMTGFVSASFSKIQSPFDSAKPNLGLSAGVRVSFGELR